MTETKTKTEKEAEAPANDIAPDEAPETAQLLSASGRVLSKRWFRIIALIWTGQAVSMVTSFAAGYAAIWYVTETTGSALMLAIASICFYLPQGLLSPFGGVAADRFNRKAIMIAAVLCVGTVSLILGVFIFMGNASFGLILSMVIVRSIGHSFRVPAMMAAMPMLVPQKHLLRINTLDQLVASIANIGAPAFGIFLYTVVGFHSVMFLDFAGALIAVSGLLFAKIPTTRDASAENQSVFANLKDGWLSLSKSRGLVVLIVGVSLGMAAFAALGALFPLMTYDHFNGDGYMAAITEAAFGIGLLTGSLILIAWGGGKRLAGLIALSAVIVGATMAACGMLRPDMFTWFVVLAGVMAVACAWFNGPLITLVQRAVPEERLGRVLGLTTALMGLTSPVGIAGGGVLAEAIGVAPFYTIGGVLCIVMGVAVYSFKSVRALDAPDAPFASQGLDAP
ncbi:MAG: MFS transporter [Eggerthellaceae bacterium]|jgi:DHA3 family macrolide efflux protein-like MFS transporter|nr:MFS transporter [Eggerthellaceae bacterium]MDR2715429.1 MFS transporter [Coriobacteriaceae bacterium]